MSAILGELDHTSTHQGKFTVLEVIFNYFIRSKANLPRVQRRPFILSDSYVRNNKVLTCERKMTNKDEERKKVIFLEDNGLNVEVSVFTQLMK